MASGVALVAALALIASAPVFADDSPDVADAAAVDSAPSGPPKQVLELPQSCGPDGGAYACDDSLLNRADPPADTVSAASPAPDATPDSTASATAPTDETTPAGTDIGSIEDYENQGIVEEPMVVTGIPLNGGYLRPAAPAYTIGPAVVGSMPSAPIYTSAVPLTAAWRYPVGVPLRGPAVGAPSFGPRAGVPMVMPMRPFPLR